MARSRLMVSLLYALFFFSGSAGLGYQMVWSRMLAGGLGHELPAVLAVVSAFMAGMALGAWALDGLIARSPRPARWYAGLELLIGPWAFLATALMPLLNRAALPLIGLESSPVRHWGVAFALPWLALLPATAAMGATFPAMERFSAPFSLDGRCVGALYAANTAGAVAGILGSAFVMIPAVGLRQTAWALAAINVICGLTVLLLEARSSLAVESIKANSVEVISRRRPGRVASVAANPSVFERPAIRPLSRLRLTVFLSGMLGIGYETVAVRVLSQALENTIYTFAVVLAVFLSGTSLGAALYHRFGRRLAAPFLLTDLLGALSASCLLGIVTASRALPLYDACRAALGDGRLAVVMAEGTVAAAVLLLPTILMGAVFSHLLQTAASAVGQASRLPAAGVSPAPRQMAGPSAPVTASPFAGGVGRAVALNTFGGALAPGLFGVWLLPLVGSKWSLVLIALGYLVLLPRVGGWRRGWLIAPVLVWFVLPENLHILQIPAGDRVVHYAEGLMASVAVVEDPRRDRVLRVDNRFQMGGTAAAAAEYRHAHIPLLLHPLPRRALFLGLGTGISFGAAALHPGLTSDGVELVPEVVRVMPDFEPYNLSPGRRAGLNVFVADARRFVRTATTDYDVIVADLFHPARDGAGSLYTLEHFRAIRARLAAGGLFCQWLPLHQLDEEMLRVIVRTFLEVFPEAQAWLLRFNVDAPVLGLVGSVEPRRYTPDWVERRLVDHDLESNLKKLALADSVRLFGNLLAGAETLRAFAGDAALNTDDRPRVTFEAPRFAYRTAAAPHGRLLTLLKLGLPDPREILGRDPRGSVRDFGVRLTRYWGARDVYLQGLVDESEGREAGAIDRFIESARLSDDFTSGYAQCLTLASVLAQSRPTEARTLLERLIEAQPSRPVAREMLQRLFGP